MDNEVSRLLILSPPCACKPHFCNHILISEAWTHFWTMSLPLQPYPHLCSRVLNRSNHLNDSKNHDVKRLMPAPSGTQRPTMALVGSYKASSNSLAFTSRGQPRPKQGSFISQSHNLSVVYPLHSTPHCRSATTNDKSQTRALVRFPRHNLAGRGEGSMDGFMVWCVAAI